MTAGRNDPCPCGSGKKYKKCCLDKDQEEMKMRAGEKKEQSGETQLEAPRKIEPIIDNKIKIDDFNTKVAMIKNALNDPKLLDAEIMFELFNELHTFTSNASERQINRELLIKLRQEHFDLYKENASYHLDSLIYDAVIDNQTDNLELYFKEFLQKDNFDIDIYNDRVDQLAYHGYLETLREGFEIAWPMVKDSEDIVPLGMDEFSELAACYELFYYLQNNPNPDASDKVLLERLKLYVDLNLTDFKKYYNHITGKASNEWTLDDFDLRKKKIKTADLSQNLGQLCNEFLYYLHEEEGKTFTRAGLMHTEINKYLWKRSKGELDQNSDGYVEGPLSQKKSKRKHNRIDNYLCPDRETLDSYLGGLMQLFNFRVYRAVACFESIPSWLRFLEMNNLVDSITREKVFYSIFKLLPSIETILTKQGGKDEVAIIDLKKAWIKP